VFDIVIIVGKMREKLKKGTYGWKILFKKYSRNDSVIHILKWLLYFKISKYFLIITFSLLNNILFGIVFYRLQKKIYFIS
jgi:hypothetical protein